MNYYKLAFQKYAVFSGRATRSEYWYFQLFNALIVFFLSLLEMSSESLIVSLLLIVYYLASFLPTLGVLVRRLHDTNRSGWWFWLTLLPVIGSLILFYFLVQASNPGYNQYGDNPKND